MAEKRQITTAEWVALEKWYKDKTGQDLPQRLYGGYIREDDPVYKEFIAAGKPGYTPPKYSAEWYTMQEQGGGKQPSWLPIQQVSPTPTAAAPVAETGATAEDAYLKRLAELEFEKFDWQKQQDIEQRSWRAGELTAQLTESARDRWQQQQNILEQEKQRAWSSAQQRFMATDMGLQSQNVELQRQVNEMQFENDRARLLTGIPSNDWITQYTLQNQPNPYKKQEVSPIDELEANLDAETKAGQRWRGELVNAQNAEAKGQPYHMTVDEIQGIINTSDEARDKLYTTWKDVEEESRDWSPQPVPQPYPNAPGWLRQYAPGLQTGQMITKQEVPTPSGQQLTAMSSNQLEQLGYYGKWAGGLTGKYPWQQLTESANLMQPKTPAGAGRFRTTPARQWV